MNYAMAALNAAVGLTPISAVLSDRKQKPRKASTFYPTPPKSSNSATRRIQGGLVLLSSVLNTGLAKALTYEEALQQSVGISLGEDFDIKGVLNSTISFASENPVFLAGGVAVLAVPLIVSQLLKSPKPWGAESARNAYARLREDSGAQLLDIRPAVEFRQVGSPDIRGLGKKAVSIVYKGEDKPGFLKKLSFKFKKPENTTLFILDKFGGNSELVAELVTANGFKAAYAIKDGAEGPRGWMNSNLPWIPPRNALSLDLSNLTDAFSDVVGEGSGGLSLPLAIAAAAGLGVLAFQEVETILQVLGSAALVQFVSKKLVFSEDRKETLKQLDEFLNTKVAPKELVDDVKQIGVAILPTTGTSKALPATTEASPNPATAESTAQKVETISEPKIEATAEPAQEINSVPQTENPAESLPTASQYLSPYPAYPDFKPPTSPTPSQP